MNVSQEIAIGLLIAANIACFIAGIALGFAVATWREGRRR